MKAIMEAHRWTGRILVGDGDDGAQAAWLLVQHTDRDLAFSVAALSCWAMPCGGQVDATTTPT
jgi:hypothetical protein